MKTILYLDQNYVSYLTKARLGVNVYPDVAAYYENLHHALREAVQENALVCPVSQFHHSESESDTRLAPEIFRTLEHLYCGVEFKNFAQIVQEQAAAALRHYLRKPKPARPRWTKAFNNDPQSHFVGRVQHINRGVLALFADVPRAIKSYHEQYGDPHPAASLRQQKESEARQLILSFYLLPVLSFALGSTDIFTVSGLDFPASLSRQCFDLLGRNLSGVEIRAFLASDQLRDAPFFDICSSLRAAMALDRGRKPKGSDLQDVLIAATVLPYCDVFATDGHIKQLIQALKLDEKYDVRVVGSRKADVLALTSLVRTLPRAQALA